jgi:hypothetical protein
MTVKNHTIGGKGPERASATGSFIPESPPADGVIGVRE